MVEQGEEYDTSDEVAPDVECLVVQLEEALQAVANAVIDAVASCDVGPKDMGPWTFCMRPSHATTGWEALTRRPQYQGGGYTNQYCPLHSSKSPVSRSS